MLAINLSQPVMNQLRIKDPIWKGSTKGAVDFSRTKNLIIYGKDVSVVHIPIMKNGTVPPFSVGVYLEVKPLGQSTLTEAWNRMAHTSQ